MKKTALFILIAGLYSITAYAEHSEYLKSLTSSAREKGLARESLELLQPLPGPGKEKVAEKLRSGMAQGAFGRALAVKLQRPTQQGKKSVGYVTDKGSLEVFADGSRFRLRGNLEGVKAVPASSGTGQMPADRLEKLGRGFIQEQLKSLVVLSREDKLTFLGTRYLRQGGSDLQGKAGSEELLANIAIFGREVSGVPVVGSGSKVAVWFSPDGQVVGVDADWPTYRRSIQNVPLLKRDALMKRVESSTTRFAETKDSRLTRFECGYVDLGATRRTARTPVQPGCSVAFQGSDPESGAVSWAKVEYVPAAQKVLPDARWPLASYIARSGEPEPGKQIPVSGVKPAPNAPQRTIEPRK